MIERPPRNEVYELLYEIPSCLAAGGPVSTLTIRRLTAADLMAVEGISGIANTRKLVQLTAKPTLTDSEFGQLDASDVREIDQVYQRFLRRGRKTGEAASST